MKNSFNIFCSNPILKYGLVALSFFLLISLLLGNAYSHLSSTSDLYFEFLENGASEKEQQRQQVYSTSVEVGSTTQGSDPLQTTSFGQNVTEQGDNIRSGKPSFSESGIEDYNRNNWITVNHDVYGTRASNQTIINKENVDMLEIKWRLINDVEIPSPPIIVGNRGYVQDYAGTVFAFDTERGKVMWKLRAGNGPTMGLSFNNGTIFAATAYDASVVAINATTGKIIWQSQILGNPKAGYTIHSPPLVWNDYVVVGSAGGGGEGSSEGMGTVRGNITALNRTTGAILWNLKTTVGEWINTTTAPPYNAGATAWSGGSLDPQTGIVYMPLGNPSPIFNATTRQMPNLYANHMVAVNITNGQIIWATPFIADGTVLNVRVPDTHDWDTSWGSSISKVKFDNGTQRKVIIGHDKMGNIIAMDAATGKEMWWRTVGKQYNTDAIPLPNGSGMIWSYGVFNYHAVDNNSTLYITATNRGVNYFTKGLTGYREGAPLTIEQGLRNGTILAIDLRTGKIKWQYQAEFPPRVSPVVTDDLVLTGYIPFTERTRSGIILALDKETGEKLWEYNVNAPIGPVGPSAGNGMIFVPTERIQKQSKDIPEAGGSIVAFGLP